MSLLIISGGQTGADQAGWRAARRCGLATGGRMPREFETEDGPRLADRPCQAANPQIQRAAKNCRSRRVSEIKQEVHRRFGWGSGVFGTIESWNRRAPMQRAGRLFICQNRLGPTQ